MVRTLPHGTTQFLSFFLLPASIFAEGINLSSFNAFQFLKIIKISITSSKSSKKLCHTTNPPTALPVGVSRVRPPQSGITPLTCTIFDPSFTALIYPRISSLYAVISGYFDYISSNWLTQCRMNAYRSLYPLSSNKVTNRLTNAHTG